MFQLVECGVALGKIVVFADVFAYVEQALDFHFQADLFKALAANGFFQSFAVILTASGKNVEYAAAVPHFCREEFAVTYYDRPGGGAN